MAMDSWLTVRPTSGKGNATIQNSGTAFKGRVQRSTIVTAAVKDMTDSKSYTVNQKPLGEFLTLDKATFTIGQAGGNVTITGKSNSAKLNFSVVSGGGIPISIPETYTVNGFSNDTGSAITGDPGAKDEFSFSIVIAVPRNLQAKRTSEVTITGSSSKVSATVTITQEVATYAISYQKGDYINSITKQNETVAYGGTATCSATLLADTQQYKYTFDGWYEGSSKVGSALALSVPNVSSERTFVAKGIRALQKYTMSVVISPTGGGTVTGAGTYEYGKTFSLAATPKTGYDFTKWVFESSESTDNPVSTSITKNSSVTALFTLKKFSVSLSTQYRISESGDWTSGTTGGTVSGGGTYNYGTTATLKATPATGYSFVGWYEGNNQVSKDLEYSFTVTKARTLVGRFQKKWFSITFVAGTGGTVNPTSARVAYGGEASSVAAAKTGYEFTGWSDGTKTATLKVTNITADATYTASFGINTYTVSYVAGTGIDSVSPTSEAVEHGSNAVGSTAVVKTGYNFDGWYNGSTRVSTSLKYAPTNVTGNMTLTAKATIKTFTITGTAQYRNTDSTGDFTTGSTGGSVTGSGTYNYGSKATLTAAAATGYDFLGWYNSSGTQVSTSTSYVISSVTSAVTVYARFQKRWFTISYSKNANIASITKTSERVAYGGTASCVAALPANTAGATYAFQGWYEDSTQVTTSLTLSVANVTSARSFEARGTSNVPNYTITATSENTSQGTVSGGGSYAYNSTVTLKAARKTGYTFDGWYEGGTRVSTDSSYKFTCTGDRTLVAKWVVYNVSIAVTWSPTASEGTVSGSLTGQEGTKTALTFTPASSYNFTRWENEYGTTGSSNSGTFTFGGTKKITIYCTLKSYTVSYTKGTGISSVSRASETVSHGSDALGSTATVSTGYTFDGWYNGSTRVSTSLTYAPTDVTKDMTLEARATINSYTVTVSAYYRMTDGTGDYASGTTGGSVSGGGSVNYGGSKTITASPATGYKFDGWYSTGASGGTLVSSSASYTISNVTSNQTVYARFTRKYYTVTYEKGDYVASLSRTSERVAHRTDARGSTMTVDKTTAQYSYSIDGWYKGSTRVSTTASIAPTDIVEDVTYKAQGKRAERSYSIILKASGGTFETANGWTISSDKATAEKIVAYGGTYGKLPTISRESTPEYTYSFLAYSPECSASTIVSGGATHYATWNEQTRTYTLTANANGGLIPTTTGWTGSGSSATKSVKWNSSLGTLPTPTRFSTAQYTYTFKGWYTEASGGVAITSNAQMGKADRSIYAQWDSTVRSYAISAALDSTSAERGTITGGGTYDYGKSVTLKCTLNNSDDVFDGWYEGDTRVSTDATYTFNCTGARTLTAKILYIDVTPDSLDFDATGGSQTLTIKSNVSDWTVS